MGSRLPTKLQFLQKYFFHKKREHLGRIKSLNLSLDAVMVFWERARIPTMRRDSALRKMEFLVRLYDKLVKNRNRSAENCRIAERLFKTKLTIEILDIGHANALSTMTNEEDKLFYKSQQDDPTASSMGQRI